MAAHLAARFEELKFLDVTRLCRLNLSSSPGLLIRDVRAFE